MLYQSSYLTIKKAGQVEWHALSDTIADATFSHPQGGSIRISWDMDRAKQAGLGTKDNWKKYPRQMLRSRIISEGVRTICPMATSGMYVPEEVQDFEPAPVTIDQPATPATPEQSPVDILTGFAKQYAIDIELADTDVKLDTLTHKNSAQMGNLFDKLPAWHARLTELLNVRRTALSTPEAA